MIGNSGRIPGTGGNGGLPPRMGRSLSRIAPLPQTKQIARPLGASHSAAAVVSIEGLNDKSHPWSNSAQTRVMRAKYAVTADEYGRALTPRPQRFASTQETVMGKVIEFYIPTIFHKPLKGAVHELCAKVIEFRTQPRKSA
jgi:hypothetical protein